MNFHPLADLFPLMEGREFDELVADIRANGLRVPIVLHTDGRVLDGRNRYRACEVAEVEPTYSTWNGVGLAADFVWSLNGPRRHLDEGAREISAARYAIAREAEAEERKGMRTDLTSVSIDTEVELGRSREKAAEKFGLSEPTVARAIKVVKEGTTELISAVEQGKVSVSAAADVASLPKQEQSEIVARGEQEILEAAKKIRQSRTAAVTQQNLERKREAAAIPPPAGQYKTIVIDPPWPMEIIDRDVRPGQVGMHYPVMSIEEIKAFQLPLSDQTTVYVWTTQRFLPDTFEVIKAWDLRYRFTMVWHKPGGPQPYNLPQYNCEFIVVATRGDILFVDTKQFFTAFQAPRREHSRKPDEFYDLVRRVSPSPRIDIFSRETREGFDQFGNEPEKFVA